MPLSSVRSTPAENLCSNLLLMELHSCLHLLYMTFVFLVFLMVWSSLKPARPRCDGRSFASPLFRRLAGGGAVFFGFPFRWVPHLALSLTRSITVHVATSYSREDTLSECSRPCNNLSCLCFNALWLQQRQSFLVQENQPEKDIDLTCFKTFPIKASTCLQVVPMSLDWPVDSTASLNQSSPSSSPEDPNDEHQGGALSSFHTLPLEAGCSSSTSTTAR